VSETSKRVAELFNVAPATVVATVGCTWCCVEAGHACRHAGHRIDPPHAQRWYEYHNATHDRTDQIRIFTRYGMQANRISRRPTPPASPDQNGGV